MQSNAPTARVAGIIPADLELPGDLARARRVVGVTDERLVHIGERRPTWQEFCLAHMAEVLGAPTYLGYRSDRDPRRVEFVAEVGAPKTWLLVAVKSLVSRQEAWVSTAHPVKPRYLTRRLATGTMRRAQCGP